MALKVLSKQEVYKLENVYYRGCSASEIEEWSKGSYPTSDRDPMPLDYEVVEYSIGDEIKDMDESSIESWVRATCDWYDGTRTSILGGLNVTSDFTNAQGYGTHVLVLKPLGEHCDFSDSHCFIRNSSEVELVGVYVNQQGE